MWYAGWKQRRTTFYFVGVCMLSVPQKGVNGVMVVIEQKGSLGKE
jgi:hypothetical protein